MKYKTVGEVVAALDELIPSFLLVDDIHFLCIGTDRSTGDALGPLVGTKLEKRGEAVTGTIENPCHAENLRERYEEIPKGKFIVAIDACLGQLSSIGYVQVYRGSIEPGAGVNKSLGAYGDIAIAPIVNIGGHMEYFVLQNTRLSIVMNLAEIVSTAIRIVMKRRRKSEAEGFIPANKEAAAGTATL